MHARTAPAILLAPLLSACGSPRAHEPPASDPYLAHLLGDWRISRSIRADVVTNDMHVEPVLGGSFVQMHMISTTPGRPYQALVLIGFDAERAEYVAHWCDSFGPGHDAVGRGRLQGRRLELVFAYPDGPFVNTFEYDGASDSWTFTGESSGSDGARKLFARDTVTRRAR